MINKKDNDSNEAPPPTPIFQENILINEYFLICPDCSSSIEILSINEVNNIIEFRCIKNNKNYIMTIKEYLQKIEYIPKNKDDIKDKCNIISHKNNDFVCYCFDCNRNLCNDCLKKRIHINHKKSNIIEIKPIKEELNIIEEVIKEYKIKLENLKNEKINKTEELNNLLNKEKIKENNKFQNIIKNNEYNKEKELKMNNDSYLSDIEEIKKRYENEIKSRKNKYENDINNIINKNKLIKEKQDIQYKTIIEELNRKYINQINNFEFDKKINNSSNIIKINEMIFNIYKIYNNNYYNNININNLLLHYCKNEYINNKIIKKILKNNYEEIIALIKQKTIEDNKFKFQEENQDKLKDKENAKLKDKENAKIIIEKTIYNKEKDKIEINMLNNKVSLNIYKYRYLIYFKLYYFVNCMWLDNI